jgi:hypothetical protein
MADELDVLYEVRQDEFTALRTKLAAAAKKRGDTDTAKQISAARKPTTAAWVVNRVALRDPDIRARLAGLGERLKDAHSAMDGDRIRALSIEQRRLVDDVARAAFEEAEVADPSAALRDDVTGTLQAAIADPDVASRLGRLTKAEQWSGFGEFGDTTMVFTQTRKVTDRKKPAEEPQRREARRPTRRRTPRTRDRAGGVGRRRTREGRRRRGAHRAAIRSRHRPAAPRRCAQTTAGRRKRFNRSPRRL